MNKTKYPLNSRTRRSPRLMRRMMAQDPANRQSRPAESNPPESDRVESSSGPQLPIFPVPETQWEPQGDRPQIQSRFRSRRPRRRPVLKVRYLMAGSSMLAFMGILAIFPNQPPLSLSIPPVSCEERVNETAALTQETFTQFLTVPERQPISEVRSLMPEPYCRLPSLEVRAGVVAEREAYPLAFEDNTWLIVLYEGDEYAGYALKEGD